MTDNERAEWIIATLAARDFDTPEFHAMQTEIAAKWKADRADLAAAKEECAKAERLWKQEAIRAERAETTIGGLTRAVEISERELAAAKDSLRQECDDADDVCELLGLRSDAYRTEGGSLNVPHIRTLLRERDEKVMAGLRELLREARGSMRLLCYTTDLDAAIDAAIAGSKE